MRFTGNILPKGRGRAHRPARHLSLEAVACADREGPRDQHRSQIVAILVADIAEAIIFLLLHPCQVDRIEGQASRSVRRAVSWKSRLASAAATRPADWRTTAPRTGPATDCDRHRRGARRSGPYRKPASRCMRSPTRRRSLIAARRSACPKYRRRDVLAGVEQRQATLEAQAIEERGQVGREIGETDFQPLQHAVPTHWPGG